MSMTDRRRRDRKRDAKHNQELRDKDNRIFDLEQELLKVRYPLEQRITELETSLRRAAGDVRVAQESERHMLLWCPACGERHIDEGEFATKLHHTHACQNCGMVWRPSIGSTFGVRYLPGFKNAATPHEGIIDKIKRLRELRSGIAIVGHDERPTEIVDEILSVLR